MVDEFQQNEPGPSDEIEKRKPKPYRYVSEPDEIHKILDNSFDQPSVMTDEENTAKILRDNFETELSVGDVDSIEQVVQKHVTKRDHERNRDIV